MWQIEHQKAFNSYSDSSLKLYVVRCLLIVSCGLLSACGGSSLYSNLPEQQANEIEAVLMRAGIDARKRPAEEEGAWAIFVPRKDLPKAVELLKAAGLPRFKNQSMGEIFHKEGFVSSPLEERARYLYALSQELSNTLMEIDGVLSARVHVALPESSILNENQQSSSVSVVIFQQFGVDLSQHVTDIKAIVTDGIEGLDDVNRVTVKFFSRRETKHEPVVADRLEQYPQEIVLSAGVSGIFLGGLFFMLVSWVRHRARRKTPNANPPTIVKSRSHDG